MAIDAKVSLMGSIEMQLSAVVTADTLRMVMPIIADSLERFDLRETLFDGDDTDDLLTCYLDALKVQGRSAKTIERYRYMIKRMMDAVKVHTRRITVYHLRQYLSAEQERGVKDSTLEGMRQIYSAYFNWLQRESLIDKNPCANLGAIKVAKREKRIFSDVDMEKMKRACKSVRDRAIISLLASSGCRISEITGLNRESIDFERLECIVHGKGNKERVVYIDAVTATLIREYLLSRKDESEALFVGKQRERLQPGGVRCMLRELEQQTGIEHVVHPHKFRRTFATNMARRGMPIQEIASIMGHEKIETTMKYIVLNKEDIKHDYRKFA